MSHLSTRPSNRSAGRGSRSPRGTEPGSHLFADLATFHRNIHAQLKQAQAAPRAAEYLRPFREAKLLDCRRPTSTERTQLQGLAAAISLPDLDDAVQDIGHALNWSLVPEARLWVSPFVRLETPPAVPGGAESASDARFEAHGPVRDALLDEAVRRNLLRLTPAATLLGMLPSWDDPPIRLTPLSRAAHVREEEWEDLQILFYALATLKDSPGPPLTAEDHFDKDRFWFWHSLPDAERSRLSPLTRFVCSLPLPPALLARLDAHRASFSAKEMEAARLIKRPEDLALPHPRRAAEETCAQYFAPQLTAPRAAEGPSAFQTFVESRLGYPSAQLWMPRP